MSNSLLLGIFAEALSGGGAYSSDEEAEGGEEDHGKRAPKLFSVVIEQAHFAEVVQVVPDGGNMMGLGAGLHMFLPAYLHTKEHLLKELKLAESEGSDMTDNSKAAKVAQVFDTISQVGNRSQLGLALLDAPVAGLP